MAGSRSFARSSWVLTILAMPTGNFHLFDHGSHVPKGQDTRPHHGVDGDGHLGNLGNHKDSYLEEQMTMAHISFDATYGQSSFHVQHQSMGGSCVFCPWLMWLPRSAMFNPLLFKQPPRFPFEGVTHRAPRKEKPSDSDGES